MSSHSPIAVTRLALLLAVLAGCASRGTPAPASDTLDTSRPVTDQGATVTADDIERQGSESIDQALEGRISGVKVVRSPSGGLIVRIRGTNSITGSNEPLYVLDGVPIEPGPDGSLTGINIRDIASIEVLKNASETAMYGLRGANGVVVIKTKRAPQ